MTPIHKGGLMRFMSHLLNTFAVPVALVALAVLAVSMLLQPFDLPYGVLAGMLSTARSVL